MEVIQIITHVEDEAHGRRCADELIERRLAACAHVRGPLHSVYRWEGVVETATEWEVDVITTSARRDACTEAILALHTYVTPAVMWTALECSADYGAWVVTETSV
jgi:periplasmic divalent cation tolerance protein